MPDNANVISIGGTSFIINGYVNDLNGNCNLKQLSSVSISKSKYGNITEEEAQAVVDSDGFAEYFLSKTTSHGLMVGAANATSQSIGFVLSTGMTTHPAKTWPLTTVNTNDIIRLLSKSKKGAVYITPLFNNSYHGADTLQVMCFWIPHKNVGQIITDSFFCRVSDEVPVRKQAEEWWKTMSRHGDFYPKNLHHAVEIVLKDIPYEGGNPVKPVETPIEPATW